jgi:CheY-like chemotaxis protein/HPt (histidine-containing phosphotransfer) domain-containing protein
LDTASSYLDDQIFAQLRADFLADARERLDAIEASAMASGEADTLLTIRREAHSVKGLAGSLGFPSITLIAHRLEDFTAEMARLSEENARDVLAYVDCLRTIVDAGRDPGDSKTSALLRSLPAHSGRGHADFQVGEARQVEVLLVAPGRAVRRMITGELRSLGFRVSTASSPWQALEMAARTQPDLVITSAVMDELSGIDLARAMRAISVTKTLPLALLTSFDAGHPDMARLPADIAVVHLNRKVTDELGDLITRFELG